MGLKQKVQKEEKLERNEQDMKITSHWLTRKKINRLKRLYQEGDYPI